MRLKHCRDQKDLFRVANTFFFLSQGIMLICEFDIYTCERAQRERECASAEKQWKSAYKTYMLKWTFYNGKHYTKIHWMRCKRIIYMVYVQRVKTMANRLYDVWHQSTTNTHNSGNQLTPVTTLFRNGNDAEPFNLHHIRTCAHTRALVHISDATRPNGLWW